jgi:UDP-N-acetylmuramoyl-tripeptide--D-alanyl-D-alanine ligase
MSFNISLSQLRQLTDAFPRNLTKINENKIAIGINTDSRTLINGEVFLALRGENFDGHQFIYMAQEKGAIAVIMDEEFLLESPINIPQLIVKNTLISYQQIAQWWRRQFNIPIVAITGSVGKTTTKELISGVLSFSGRVLKTEANYNNEIGVPKTLLGLHESHDYAVIEMGMRARGEIAELTNIAQPTIGVITNVGTAHIGRLGSELAIAQAKCELLEQMNPQNVAILNHDNPLLMEVASSVWQGETLTYGLEGGDYQGKLLDIQTLEVEGKIFSLPLPGRHNALNYLAALCVGKVVGIDWDLLTQSIRVDLPQGRSQQYDLSGGVVILDETYNAGLESMVASLDLLKAIPAHRYIGVLGAMKELGEKSSEIHCQVGKKVKQLNLDFLFVLTDDPEAEGIIEGAQGITNYSFQDKDSLVEALLQTVQSGDRLLFKASNSVGLSEVVEKFRHQWEMVEE